MPGLQVSAETVVERHIGWLEQRLRGWCGAEDGRLGRLGHWLLRCPHGPAVLIRFTAGSGETGGLLVALPKRLRVADEALTALDPVIVAVHPAYRTLGPLARMHRALEQWATEVGIPLLLATPPRPHATIYRWLGYRRVGAIERWRLRVFRDGTRQAEEAYDCTADDCMCLAVHGTVFPAVVAYDWGSGGLLSWRFTSRAVDAFEVADPSGGRAAWGIVTARGRVGVVEACGGSATADGRWLEQLVQAVGSWAASRSLLRIRFLALEGSPASATFERMGLSQVPATRELWLKPLARTDTLSAVLSARKWHFDRGLCGAAG